MANNAVGFLALFVALGGVGYAATGGFTSGGKLQACVNESGGLTLLKSGKHCKRGQKTVSWNMTGPAGAPGASGGAGTVGAAGGAGTKGDDGARGPEGESGTARAYGVINAAGSVVPSKSKGLTAFKTETGAYCVEPTEDTGIDFTTIAPVATVDFSGSGNNHMIQAVNAPLEKTEPCFGGWLFVTDNFNAGKWERQNIAFTVLVP